jgi:hypothetical protein
MEDVVNWAAHNPGWIVAGVLAFIIFLGLKGLSSALGNKHLF